MIMHVRRTAGCLAALLTVGLVAGCSSSGGPDTAGPGASSNNASSGASGGGGSSASSGSTGSSGATSPAASGTPADASTTKAITAAYAAFFNSKSAPSKSEAALQNGRSFRTTLVQQSKGAYSKNSAAKVTAISVNGNVGYVTFTLTSNGAALIKGFKGYAVRENGTWKVAAITFCTLLQLEGNPPSVCNDPTITALPT